MTKDCTCEDMGLKEGYICGAPDCSRMESARVSIKNNDLRAENKRLRACLVERDAFIVSKGLWLAYVETLVHKARRGERDD